MNILAIDTSTIAASVAVISEEKLLAEAYTDLKLKHSEKLLPLVDHILCDLRMNIDDIDAFAAGSGPGSFTGIRIGAASIKAFAHANNKPVIGISSLEACAFGQAYFPGHICPIFDAQRDEVYTALFKFEESCLTRLSEDSAVSIDKLIQFLKDKESILFCGDGLYKFKSFLSETLGQSAYFANKITSMPRASSVGCLALSKLAKGEISDYKSFLPDYIRKPQIDQPQKRYEYINTKSVVK